MIGNNLALLYDGLDLMEDITALLQELRYGNVETARRLAAKASEGATRIYSQLVTASSEGEEP